MLRKYQYVFTMGLQRALTYRLNYVVGIMASGFPILLQLMLWKAIFEYSQTDVVYGFTYQQMITYVILSALLGQALRTGFEYEVATDIKEGGLNRFLIQPISYLGYRLMAFLGGNIAYFICTLFIMGGCIALFYHLFGLTQTPNQLAIFTVSLFFALLMQFLLFYTIGLLAFWAQEVWGIFESTRIIGLVLSGGVFPLTIFGDKGLALLSWLPFKYIIFFPLEIVTGRLTLAESISGLLIQLSWIAILLLLSHLIWRQGCKKFIALGG